jgi:hypothetical protein
MSVPNTVILISGFARAGKDTFADGMMSYGGDVFKWKRSFASTLKEAADNYLDNVGLFDCEQGITFSDEEFKVRHRDILVTLGAFARSINKDVFAESLFRTFLTMSQAIRPNPMHFIVPDWRYLNEALVGKRWAEEEGWRIVTVRIDRAGLQPANMEEAVSLAEIRRQMPCDFEYAFAEGQTDAIKTAGRQLAAHLGL